MAATSGVTRWLTSAETKLGPNGTPSETRGTNEAMLYQKMIWTSRGVPLKNQM